MTDILRINNPKVIDYLVNFIQTEFAKTGLKTAIIGLSGGLDSTVVAYLCVLALGKENVFGIVLPSEQTSKKTLGHALSVVRTLGIHNLRYGISSQINEYFKNFPQADKKRIGNKMARERMSILYDLSVHFKGLVVGTSNKTERLLGYGTIYGDLACALNPIGNLYKTQIRSLAKYLKVPPEIIDKPPSAELWQGQTDEGDFGFSYEQADEILYYYVDQKMSPEDIADKEGILKDIVKEIIRRIRQNAFKGKMPVIAEIPDKVKNDS